MGHAGRRALVVNPGAIPARLQFMVNPNLIGRFPRQDWWREFDLLGILDCGEADRLDEINRQAAVSGLPVFTIDHHISSRGLGTAWIEPDASSTGEMTLRLIRAAGWPLTPGAAQSLWIAIATDTGRFSYENTTPAALEAARECLLAGADPALVTAHIYQSITAAERFLQTRLLARMEIRESGRLALSWLTADDFSDAGPGSETTEDLINLLRDTAGVEVALLLSELPDRNGSIKASLRTASPHDAVRVVEQFGGGGHARAAGCSLPGPLEKAKQNIVSAAAVFFSGD